MSTTPTPTLHLERTFDASPEALWAAWTDPRQYAKWFNPAPGIDLVIHEFDVRPGGRIRFDMPQPDGNKNPQEGVFHALDPHRELVSGSPDRSFLLRVTFEPLGARTRMRIEVTGVPPEYHAMATLGWNAGFDKLEAHLYGADRMIVLTRLLDAPREAVFDAWCDPKQVAQWWGPNGFTTTVHEMDVRPGGVWRFVMHGPDGTDYDNLVVFEEVTRPERLAFTHGSPENPEEARVLVRFADEGGKTRILMRNLFPTPEARAHVESFGAVELGNQTLAKLEEHVARVRKG